MKKLNKKQREELLVRLLTLYPNAECALHYKTIYQLLIAVVLSAQTTDRSVNEVTPELFERCPDAKSMSKISEEELQKYLKRLGMYKTKARNIRNLSMILVDKYDGQVPRDYEQLIALPGVGRKTANVVLSVGFGEPRIAVDTHVFRLANRIGIVNEKNVLNTELALMKCIPKEQWSDSHHALIWHGRLVCMARNPKCEECSLNNLCAKNNLNKK
ncbi:endonuclease III [Anaerovorax sp. IOR16]|uniref:endonuclease III n=1 Tax=Anaerovorax sp. IOR16 TaxID=2773458 RepID=UPI0019D1F4B3|nr:endonuclease III [Anaerovorax sp. IOR16]